MARQIRLLFALHIADCCERVIFFNEVTQLVAGNKIGVSKLPCFKVDTVEMISDGKVVLRNQVSVCLAISLVLSCPLRAFLI